MKNGKMSMVDFQYLVENFDAWVDGDLPKRYSANYIDTTNQEIGFKMENLQQDPNGYGEYIDLWLIDLSDESQRLLFFVPSQDAIIKTLLEK